MPLPVAKLPPVAPRRAPRLKRLPLPVMFFLAFMGAMTTVGKGPTYLGIGPLFWAEIAMGWLLVWTLARGGWDRVFLPWPRYLSAVITAFMSLGFVLTVIGIPYWGLDAARDAAIWYYGVFYFLGLYLAQSEGIGDRVWSAFRVFWCMALVYNVTNFLSGRAIETMPPMLPSRGVSIWFNSNSEVIQQMTMGAMLVLTTSYLRRRLFLRVVLSIFAVLGLGFMAIDYGRGAKVGVVVGLLMAASLSFGKAKAVRVTRTIVPIVLVAVLGVVAAVAWFDLDIVKVSRFDRFIRDQGTASWRTLWWKALANGVMDENPLFGLGFGRDWRAYNPEIDTGYEPFPVRAPHNFNITVFSRMGIVGAALWASILAMGIGGLYRRVWRYRYPPERQQELAFWIMFIVCTWLNSTFGVLMEGPVLGVWFWLAMGFAWGRSRRQVPVAGVAR